MSNEPNENPHQDDEPVDGSPDASPGAIHGSFRRVHPREFFGPGWEPPGRGPGSPALPKGPLPRPQEGTGVVIIERREQDLSTWHAAWEQLDGEGVLIASVLGPAVATLEECIDWALHGVKAARVSINLLD